MAKNDGADRSLLETVDVLKKRGVESFVFLPKDGQAVTELKKRNVPYAIVPYLLWMERDIALSRYLGFAKLFWNLLITIKLAKIISKYKCNIVYSNTITVINGALLAKMIGRPHVWHIREFGYEDHKLVYDLGPTVSYFVMDRLTSIFIANSEAVKNKYEKYLRRPIKVVYQWVNTLETDRSFKGGNGEIVCRSTIFKCAIVGTICRGKGQEDAIKAIGELFKIGINIKLYIIGVGDLSYKKYLDNIVLTYSIKENIEYLGYVDNASAIMETMDVVLVCSRCEAFGRVTVEAMRNGKPVIGARSGGTVELIKENKNGLLYTPRDYQELAKKIRYLFEHRDKARKMGENGRDWAATMFTEVKYGDRILEILESAVANEGRAAF
jgi:glycosyltransferase involved in cell wall biosynthesis